MIITLFLILKTGTQNWTPYNIKEIATATGGVFIQVCNETQLSEAIQQIQNAISFEKRPLKKPAKMFKPDRGMLVKLFKEIYDVSKIPL